jgi:hypothetical protein
MLRLKLPRPSKGAGLIPQTNLKGASRRQHHSLRQAPKRRRVRPRVLLGLPKLRRDLSSSLQLVDGAQRIDAIYE